MKRILLTGAAGFIGHNTIKWFKDNPEYEIVSIVDSLTYAGIHKDTVLAEAGITPYWFDITTVNWSYVFNQVRPDIVINMAAESHVDNSLDVDAHNSFLRSNTQGPLNIVAGIRNYKQATGRDIFFVQVSTDEVLGSFPLSSQEEASEDYPLCPNNPYSATKAMAEIGIQALYRSYGDFSYTIVRATNNFGDGQHPEKFIPKALDCVKNGQTIPVYGTGENIREWLWVDDFIQGIKLVLDSYYRDPESVVNEIFHFGSRDRLNNLDLISNMRGNARYEFVTDRIGHDLRYALNSDKARTILGWRSTATVTGWLHNL